MSSNYELEDDSIEFINRAISSEYSHVLSPAAIEAWVTLLTEDLLMAKSSANRSIKRFQEAEERIVELVKERDSLEGRLLTERHIAESPVEEIEELKSEVRDFKKRCKVLEDSFALNVVELKETKHALKVLNGINGDQRITIDKLSSECSMNKNVVVALTGIVQTMLESTSGKDGVKWGNITALREMIKDEGLDDLFK